MKKIIGREREKTERDFKVGSSSFNSIKTGAVL